MKKLDAEYIIAIIGVFLSIMSVYIINIYMNNRVLNNNNKESVVTSNNEIADNLSTTVATTEVIRSTGSTTTSTVKTTRMSTAAVTTTTTTTTTKSLDIIWDDLTKDELIVKLNKNLYDTLSGTGVFFANYTEKTGLDPYLAVSIVNLETGCKWGCSSLVKKCYNIGGLKGKPACNGGSYMRYNSLEEGINGYLDILYNNYWQKGLTTPELMNSKYAASSTWAEKVNKYYDAIKAS